MPRLLPALAVPFVVCAFAGGAIAYVRATTDIGRPVFLPNNCAFITPDARGSPDLPLGDVIATLEKSIANWQSPTLAAGCSYMRISLDAAAPVEATLDYRSVLKFRTDRWCRPAETGNPEMCFSSDATAITSVFFASDPGKPDDGAILDADIEMNNVNYTFVREPTTTVARTGTRLADLENTLTHELGHFQGLAHSCWEAAPGEADPLDNAGALVPNCNDLASPKVSMAESLKIRASTMYPFSSSGETSKRMPQPDDLRAICDVYPAAANPNTCRGLNTGGGCHVGRTGDFGGNGSQAAGVVLMILGLNRRYRRYRRDEGRLARHLPRGSQR